MVVTVKCQSCGTSLKLQQAFTKSIKEFKCLKCGAMIPIGDSGGAPAAPRPGSGGRTGVFKTISTACSGCKRPMNLPPDLAGRKIRCKDCGTVFQVPVSTPSGAPAAASGASAEPAPSVAAEEPKTIVLPVDAIAPQPSAPVAVPPQPAAGPADATIAAMAAPPAPGASPANPGEASPADALRRAETAEAALRVLAGQYAVEKAGLLHEIETLKAKANAAGSATPLSLAAELDRMVLAQNESLKARVEEIKKALK